MKQCQNITLLIHSVITLKDLKKELQIKESSSSNAKSNHLKDLHLLKASNQQNDFKHQIDQLNRELDSLMTVRQTHPKALQEHAHYFEHQLSEKDFAAKIKDMHLKIDQIFTECNQMNELEK